MTARFPLAFFAAFLAAGSFGRLMGAARALESSNPSSPPPSSPAQASPPPSSPDPNASSSAPSVQGPTFPAEVELVTVDVVVTDKKGVPVTDLGREDFVLSEDGAVQTISSYEAIQITGTPSAVPPAK